MFSQLRSMGGVLVSRWHLLGALWVIALLWCLRHWTTPAWNLPEQQPLVAVLGSSNLLTSLDATLLDSLEMEQRKWVNLSQQGLTGEALLSEGLRLVESVQPGQIQVLCIEIIDAPVNDLSIHWRLAQQVQWSDFIRGQILDANAQEDTLEWAIRARAILQHGLMRATSGWHALIHPKVESSKPLAMPMDWQLRSAADSAWLMQLKAHEESLRRFLRDPGKANETLTSYPIWLLDALLEVCTLNEIQLVPVIQPASAIELGLISALRARNLEPVILDGGLNPSPFSNPSLMSDPRHVNNAGARAVTLHFFNRLTSIFPPH